MGEARFEQSARGAVVERVVAWDREVAAFVSAELEAFGPEAPGCGEDDALDDAYAHLEEELGDLLYQVFFHSVLAAENGRFTVADVARGIHDKLERRHPHVFGDLHAASSDEVLSNWEQIKKAEKGRDSIFDGIPATLPALLYAAKVVKKASSLGLAPDAVDDGSVGARLLALAAAARDNDLDPELELRAAADRLKQRAQALESP